MPILEVSDLKTTFYTRNGTVRAVDGVSFRLDKGKSIGIVGESGSGKSVSCYSLLGLIPQPPGRIEGGRALFHGEDLLSCGSKRLRQIRGAKISMIFQDPMTSLNPYMKISSQLLEPLILHRRMKGKAALAKGIEALEEVGIHDAAQCIHQYPHEFSGGMRQRVMIAMALITDPEILIADEPTTALDVTVQAQILELIQSRQEKSGTSVIFITHDLGVVAGMCDSVHVMYAGKIVESGTTDDIFYQSAHPYTVALQRSIPATHQKGEILYTIPGMPPDLSLPFAGCAFADRCDYAIERCRDDGISLKPIQPGHSSACQRFTDGEIDLNLICRDPDILK